MKIETNKAVVRQFIKAINQQDFTQLDAVVSIHQTIVANSYNVTTN